MSEDRQISLIARPWFRVFALCGAAELLSYLTWFVPVLALPTLLLISVVALILALRDPRLGFLILLAEAVIGSHGHLVTVGPVSLRMVLFAAAIIGWVVSWWRVEAGPVAGSDDSPPARNRVAIRLTKILSVPLFWPLVAVAVAVLWGVARGLMLGHGLGAVVGDANAYAFILAVPMAFDLFRRSEDREHLKAVLIGSVLWLAVASVALLYLFSHDFNVWLVDLYQWQRHFLLSEVTRLGETAWNRVFAASDLFLIPALALGVFRFWSGGWKTRLWSMILAAALLLSFSRSFWLGLLAGAIVLAVLLARRRALPFSRLKSLALAALAVLVLGAALLAALTFLPWPASRGGVDLSAFSSRFTVSDAAVSSRWNLLPVLYEGIKAHPFGGSGFGATVTYRTDDPRLISLSPGGVITTGAIEWQYLEIWLKLGLPGLLALGWLIVAALRLFWRGSSRDQNDGLDVPAAVFLSFVAFVVLNIFTPYWNHPLGWMYLALLSPFLVVPESSRPASDAR